MTKKRRKKVFEKFGGRCAYSGSKLKDDDWQIDHCIPKSHQLLYPNDNLNSFWNLIPVVPIINHYKRAKDLEQFRTYIKTLHKRLRKLPIKTRCMQTEKRAKYLLAVADHFGVTRDKAWNGIFYFEKYNNGKARNDNKAKRRQDDGVGPKGEVPKGD